MTNKETNATTVIDTKYKNYGAKKIDTADVFQLAFYAQYFHTQLNTKHKSIIIYPRYAGESLPKDFTLQLLAGTQHEGLLRVKDISIDQTLVDIKQGNDSELKKLAMELI